MNETIHYISPLSYITDISHLKKHIKYITRQQARPFTTIDNEKINAWIEKAKEEKRKRIDARVAMKFVIAIPNDRKDDISFFKKVGYFLEEFFQVDRDNIDLTVHRDNEENIHMHVLVYPRRTDGKKLRLTKNDLRNWHKKWDEFLEREGYTVVRDKVEERLNHLGWKLHADPELKASYTEYKQNKKQIKQIHNNIQKTQQIDTILTDLRKLKLALEIELKVRTIEERVANRVRAKQQQTQTQAIATYQKPIQANQQNNLQKPIQQKQIQANLKEPSLAQAIQQIQQQKANTQEGTVSSIV